MVQIRYHIPQFILGILFGILVVVGFVYLSGLGDKIDKIYSSINRPVSCETLPYGVQEKIEQTYENIASATCEITK